jgi:hypothetical protein
VTLERLGERAARVREGRQDQLGQLVIGESLVRLDQRALQEVLEMWAKPALQERRERRDQPEIEVRLERPGLQALLAKEEQQDCLGQQALWEILEKQVRMG